MLSDSLKIESLEEFVKELRMLQRLGQHPNIINLVGACLLQGESRGHFAGCGCMILLLGVVLLLCGCAVPVWYR